MTKSVGQRRNRPLTLNDSRSHEEPTTTTMVFDRRLYLAEGIAIAGAVGMLLLIAWQVLLEDPTTLVMMPDSIESAVLLLVTIGVAAIGAAIGVWIENIPLAVLGTTIVFLFGAGQGVVIGPPILLFAMMLATGTYLQWRRLRRQPT